MTVKDGLPSSNSYVKSSERPYCSDRLRAIILILGEADFCIKYGLNTNNPDRLKFFNLGKKVIGDMSTCLQDIKDELDGAQLD